MGATAPEPRPPEPKSGGARAGTVFVNQFRMRKLTFSGLGSSFLKGVLSVGAAAVLMMASPAQAQNSGDSGGECSGGLCGTPEMTGGGCGCGGGSILINNTDIGQTYQFADDYDNDGFEDDFDNCPFVANPEQLDSDGDGVGDACDNCVSAANANQTDTDSDGIGDACDDDRDNDGVLNATDVCDLVADPAQLNSDDDNLGNACDPDDDGDGVLDSADNCPLLFNPEQAEPTPAQRDLCDSDSDGDGVPDKVDNCLAERNFNQADMDSDGVGDACDGDIDDDGIANLRDNCPRISNNDPDGPPQSDVDRDRIGDACDDRLCYVILANTNAESLSSADLNHCLDPDTTFTVLSFPTDRGKVGEASHLHLFANRENAAMRYVWRIVRSPNGSDARIENPRGSVAVSTPWEYLYVAGKRAQLTPDVPGEYELQVSAELIFGDDRFPQASTSVATFLLSVEEGDNSGGCTSTRGDLSLAGLAMLAMIGFVARRRRRC